MKVFLRAVGAAERGKAVPGTPEAGDRFVKQREENQLVLKKLQDQNFWM